MPVKRLSILKIKAVLLSHHPTFHVFKDSQTHAQELIQP